jgi:uncharacterized damage-inducible protein DinB
MARKPASRRVITVLLAEYRRAIADLIARIEPVSPSRLAAIADPSTRDNDCVSIQSVLTHVVHCGYRYLKMMDEHLGDSRVEKPVRVKLAKVSEYQLALEKLADDTEAFFASLDDKHMVAYEPRQKIKTSWGQYYDFEQLMEHAIVHVLRHRYQIEGFMAAARARRVAHKL